LATQRWIPLRSENLPLETNWQIVEKPPTITTIEILKLGSRTQCLPWAKATREGGNFIGFISKQVAFEKN